MNFNNFEHDNGSPKFRKTNEKNKALGQNEINSSQDTNQFISLNNKQTFNSPNWNNKNYSLSTPHRYIEQIPSSIAEPNIKAKKPEFGKFLKSSQFLTESKSTSKKADKKMKSMTCSDMVDTINHVDSSFNFLIDSLIQGNNNNGPNHNANKNSIDEGVYYDKTIEKSDSLTAMQLLNKKYNLGLDNLEKLSERESNIEDENEFEGKYYELEEKKVEMFESQNPNLGIREIVHPKLRVNFGQGGSNAKSDEVDLRSISHSKVKRDRKKHKYSPGKSNSVQSNLQRSLFKQDEEEKTPQSTHVKDPQDNNNFNPLKINIDFSKQKNNNTAIMESFGFIQNENKENQNPNVQSNKESLKHSEQIDELNRENKNIFRSRRDSENSKSPSANSNARWPFAYQKDKKKCRSYAISSTIRSEGGASVYQRSVTGAKSEINGIGGEISQHSDDEYTKVNSYSNPNKNGYTTSPMKSLSYLKTEKRKLKPYYSSLKTKPFVYNTVSSQAFSNQKKYGEKISVDLNRKLRYIGESKSSLYHGEGKIMTYNGEIIYEGCFENGLYHGKGKLVNYLRKNKYADQDISTDIVRKYMSLSNPNFRKDVRGCRGITSLNFQEDGWESYDGFFKFGKMNGNGFLVLSDGRKFEGNFENGIACGYGILDAFGKKTAGVWKDNIIVQFL